MLLAQTLLEKPAMFNHHRGLWGYTGTASDGQPLTVQSTGMGGPSAAIVVAELADLGARRLLRIGTCGALSPTLRLGELLIVTEAIPCDGTSRALGASARALPDEQLTEALRLAGAGRVHAAPVVSTDLFYDTAEDEEHRWIDAGAFAVEMETAALLTLARRRGLRAGSLLLVSDLVAGPRERISARELREAEQRLGELALRAMIGDGENLAR